jgi:hypothetical protein
MNNTLLIMLALVAIVLVGGWLLYSKRRSDHLRSRFGAEYERQVENRAVGKPRPSWLIASGSAS